MFKSAFIVDGDTTFTYENGRVTVTGLPNHNVVDRFEASYDSQQHFEEAVAWWQYQYDGGRLGVR